MEGTRDVSSQAREKCLISWNGKAARTRWEGLRNFIEHSELATQSENESRQPFLTGWYADPKASSWWSIQRRRWVTETDPLKFVGLQCEWSLDLS